ncbi:GNAT family N-acetyltransferase [Cognatiluteimonas lumbrici]|uniref:GNAT family N-acetyltransferase n=1 Tax=Cognatiluteimonas lumbrici TaxID=2559601 RepID=UPI00112698B9|nr:GNAT family N-acetyltransferase [Luteimonas lumbrici]
MTEARAIDIGHDAERRRFSATVDGHLGYVDYALDGGVLEILHTIVPDAIGGRGIAGQLVRAALDHARANGLRVRPTCPYADAWMRRHPDYEPLREGAGG